MNPKKISLFLTLVLLSLSLLASLSKPQQDKEGAKEGFKIAGVFVKFPMLSSITALKEVETNDKALEIMKQAEDLIEQDSVNTKLEADKAKKNALALDKKRKDSIALAEREKNEKTTIKKDHIYYPKNEVAYLKNFQAKLKQSNCRIVHYGDSQIEVDRITAYVRNKFQKEYGGSGPGFFPLKIVYDQRSIKVSNSGNWYRYAAFDRKQNRLAHKKYGLYATLSRFTKNIDVKSLDVATKAKMPIKVASITIEPTRSYYQKLKQYTKLGIHYGNSFNPVSISIYNNDILIASDSLKTDGKYHNYQMKFAETPQRLKIVFEGKISPDFYGITLDATSGISIDNVPMRGESGRIFRQLDAGVFSAMSAELHPDIFIFQYGGNTIPYTKTEEQIKGYVRVLMSNIKWVQSKNPKATILVVGPADMATSIKGQMLSYPMVPILDKELREKSTENGFAYWSLFETMGGRNSMTTWVSKGYAVSDYVHFSPKGAELMGELFYKNLEKDLQQVKDK